MRRVNLADDVLAETRHGHQLYKMCAWHDATPPCMPRRKRAPGSPSRRRHTHWPGRRGGSRGPALGSRLSSPCAHESEESADR